MTVKCLVTGSFVATVPAPSAVRPAVKYAESPPTSTPGGSSFFRPGNSLPAALPRERDGGYGRADGGGYRFFGVYARWTRVCIPTKLTAPVAIITSRVPAVNGTRNLVIFYEFRTGVLRSDRKPLRSDFPYWKSSLKKKKKKNRVAYYYYYTNPPAIWGFPRYYRRILRVYVYRFIHG